MLPLISRRAPDNCPTSSRARRAARRPAVDDAVRDDAGARSAHRMKSLHAPESLMPATPHDRSSDKAPHCADAKAWFRVDPKG